MIDILSVLIIFGICLLSIKWMFHDDDNDYDHHDYNQEIVMEIQGVPDIVYFNDDLHLSSELLELLFPIVNSEHKAVVIDAVDGEIFNEWYHKNLKDEGELNENGIR